MQFWQPRGKKVSEKFELFCLNFQKYWKFFSLKKIFVLKTYLRTGVFHFWQSLWRNSSTSSRHFRSMYKNILKPFLKKNQVLKNFHLDPSNATLTNLAENCCAKTGKSSANFRKTTFFEKKMLLSNLPFLTSTMHFWKAWRKFFKNLPKFFHFYSENDTKKILKMIIWTLRRQFSRNHRKIWEKVQNFLP